MKTLNAGDSYTYMKHILTIIKREGDIVLAFNPSFGYEVFKIRHRQAIKFPYRTISELGEYPPTSSEFGQDAFHWMPKYHDLAYKDFKTLVEKYSTYHQESYCSIVMLKMRIYGVNMAIIQPRT